MLLSRDGLVESAQLASNYNDIAIGWLEKAACVVDVGWSACRAASDDADRAHEAAVHDFANNGLHNGKGDAFRHCYWNARMVWSIGSNNAMKIASNHEALSSGPEAEKKMDLANNATGRSVGLKSTSVDGAKNTCSSMARKGQLKTL